MIEELLNGLWRIESPLPHNPLKSINSYLIKGDGRFLLIDTGMYQKESLHSLTSSLKKLKVDLGKTDFFLTHLHHDHMGLVSTLSTEKSKVYFNKPEKLILAQLTSNTRWMIHRKNYTENGFPLEKFREAESIKMENMYGPAITADLIELQDGDLLEMGDYRLKCILTPGHSPSHICLYEENKKILFSGDHILFDITPHISYWPELNNALGRYLESLDKTLPLEVKLALPGHRQWQNNHQARIRELQAHHAKRCQEILATLEGGANNAYHIASHISWEITATTWDHFPIEQKFFAVGETMSHLEYLTLSNNLNRRTVNGIVLYSLA